MRRDLCLMVALCLLVSLLAVAMATEGKTGPGPGAVAMATEKKTGHGPLPPLENDQRQSSRDLGLEYQQRRTGSNSSVTAAGKGHVHVLLSSEQEKHVLKPSISISQDDIGRTSTDAPNEGNTPNITPSPYDPDQDHGTGRLLVAVARTLVTTTASTTTVILISTCQATPLPTTACTGRKKRKLVSLSSRSSEAVLDSSIESGPVLADKFVERAGRLILWSSTITTVLITTTTTNGATIVTASYTCSWVGMVACG